ncbi:CAP domain-containing protein [Maribellus comscasis]|uniref:CAP domain-containing protein n=1 Tax=Maribellus comscasis TaxID=2681766 RepID=A0A6I6K2A4_9BACT|nr:CAP domain-containing protein [Maribellus comscasis]QGY46627.1 CAP domain-containing protein [Maribellus comscasis]
MKLVMMILWLAGFPLNFFSSEEDFSTTTNNWDSNLNTAASTNYLSPLEKEIIFEINKLRSNPAKYANDYIAPLSKNYQRNMLYYPGDKPLRTREGVRALNECVRDLRKQGPLSLVYPSRGLTKAADDHVKDQSRTGRTGHSGSDRSNAKTRIERYGQWKVRIAENIAYGGITAQQIVIYLLIDDGVYDRGHRKTFLHPDFNEVGVATGNHPEYGIMSVMDFAGAFVEK